MGGQTDSQVSSQVHTLQKAVNFTHIYMTCNQLVSTCVGWPNGEKLAWSCVEFELDQSQVSTSPRNSTQVGETKQKLNASHKLALDCVDLRVRLAKA